jgi:hypothetical protein
VQPESVAPAPAHSTIVDRVLIPQPGDSDAATSGKWLLFLAVCLAPTGIGACIAAYFIFMGVLAWTAVRKLPGYVPFRWLVEDARVPHGHRWSGFAVFM